MKTKTPYLQTLLFYLLPLLAAAQSPHPAFRHYTTADGLPSPEVFEVIQDRRGYLWFGTDHGVSRFNGYEFENFGAEEGLRDNVIFYLQEDVRGRIWMVSMNERLYYYDYALDSILTYEHNDLLQQHVKEQTGTLGFYVDSLGAVYRSLALQGVLRIDPDGAFALLPDESWEGPIIIEAGGQYFFSGKKFSHDEYRKNIPFAYYDETGLKKSLLENKFQTHSLPQPYFLALSDKHLLLYCNNYFYALEEGTLQWARPDPDFQIVSGLQDPKGPIYLGGLRKGLRIYQNEEALRKNTFTNLLPGYTVSHILKDRQGGFWLTTTENGVFYLPQLAYNVYDASSGLPDDNIVSLAIRHPDSVWVATRNGSVALIDRAKERIHLLDRPWGNTQVFELKYGPEGVLWMATSKGTYKYGPDGRTRQLPLPPALGYTTGIVFSKKNSDRHFLLHSKGFIKTDRSQRNVFSNSSELDFGKRLNALFEDSAGRVWIGTPDGLLELQNDSTLVPVTRHPNMSLRIEAIAELPDSTLVLGTKGAGLLLWKDDSFREMGMQQGLVSGMIETLHIDDAQNIWVGTFEGISRVSPDGSVENYTIKDGLPSNEIMAIDSYDKRVWAATRQGLVEIIPKTSTPAPRPLLEEIQVNNAPYQRENMQKLPYTENNIQLTFLAVDYTQDGKIGYRYRLQPEAPWNFSRNRTINYAALEWGQYQFEVQAQSKDGDWSPSTYLSFSIRPPFWLTGWFWGLIVLVISAVSYLFYQNRLHIYRQELAFRQLQLEREKEKTATEKSISQLQASALRAQMNPHFIYNCLNSIQSFIATGNKTQASRYLARFAKLVRGALNASLNHRISLEEETTMLENYLALEQMRFDHRFTYQVRVEDPVDPFETTLPPLLVQPFVENAILHGLTDKEKEGHIEIRFQRPNGRLQVTITDNGIGISTSQRRKKKRPSLHKSVGMTLTRRRLHLLDRSRNDEAVKIVELKDEKGAVLGTQVVIEIA